MQSKRKLMVSSMAAFGITPSSEQNADGAIEADVLYETPYLKARWIRTELALKLSATSRRMGYISTMCSRQQRARRYSDVTQGWSPDAAGKGGDARHPQRGASGGFRASTMIHPCVAFWVRTVATFCDSLSMDHRDSPWEILQFLTLMRDTGPTYSGH